MVLDRVVAVVNRHVILSSDIDEEIRLSVLDPGRGGHGRAHPHDCALDQLISRALIQQQIRREDEQAAEPCPAEVDARLAEIRKELPACVRAELRLRRRLGSLSSPRTISPPSASMPICATGLRFSASSSSASAPASTSPRRRSKPTTAIRSCPHTAPAKPFHRLRRVSPRIEEILLQQQVNVLFDEWLTNLRKQGDVEVLDPALESTDAQEPAPGVPQASTPIAA